MLELDVPLSLLKFGPVSIWKEIPIDIVAYVVHIEEGRTPWGSRIYVVDGQPTPTMATENGLFVQTRTYINIIGFCLSILKQNL